AAEDARSDRRVGSDGDDGVGAAGLDQQHAVAEGIGGAGAPGGDDVARPAQTKCDRELPCQVAVRPAGDREEASFPLGEPRAVLRFDEREPAAASAEDQARPARHFEIGNVQPGLFHRLARRRQGKGNRARQATGVLGVENGPDREVIDASHRGRAEAGEGFALEALQSAAPLHAGSAIGGSPDAVRADASDARDDHAWRDARMLPPASGAAYGASPGNRATGVGSPVARVRESAGWPQTAAGSPTGTASPLISSWWGRDRPDVGIPALGFRSKRAMKSISRLSRMGVRMRVTTVL